MQVASVDTMQDLAIVSEGWEGVANGRTGRDGSRLRVNRARRGQCR